MAKVFLIDLTHCNGCYGCQIACKDEHCEQAWLPYAAAQPLTGQFWMRVDEKDRGQVPWVKVAYIPTLCAHCSDAPCANACKEAAFKRRDDGLLLIDPAMCNGCGDCVSACPQGSISLNVEQKIAQKCSGCAHLLDNGWNKPRCADACPHEAIQYKEEAEFGELLSKAETLEGVSAFGSKVYYLGLPKRFVAGSVIDFDADEVLIGAHVTLQGMDGSTVEIDSNDLGDFIVDGLAPALYQITIAAAGYASLELKADLCERDLSLGDLGLVKAS